MWVYLPPQYFQKPYAHYKFPVIELLHGSPGNPQAWVDVMEVIPTFLSLLEAHPSDAAVLVMPDTDGGQQYSLQCLNNPGGIQDMTFVAQDVPDYIARLVRVQPPGPAWGLAGYSEGGYCTANIALQDPGDYGAAGVMSGYFAPTTSQVPAGYKPGGKPTVDYVFVGHPALLLVNSPQEYITKVPIGTQLPTFWLAAGAQDKQDVQAAASFRQLAADPPGGRAVRYRVRWTSRQRLARGPRPDARLDDSAAGAGREGGRSRGGARFHGPAASAAAVPPRHSPGLVARRPEEEVASSSGFLPTTQVRRSSGYESGEIGGGRSRPRTRGARASGGVDLDAAVARRPGGDR